MSEPTRDFYNISANPKNINLNPKKRIDNIVSINKNMKENKHIDRDEKGATKMYDNRSLENDYRTLKPILRKGMLVLDVGCGTGAISKDIAKVIGNSGKVVGIDNTEKFIENGKKTNSEVKNLELIHSDLFDFNTNEKFDLIVSARVLQWLSTPGKALLKMKNLLKPNGQISILDYNHEDIEWVPSPPQSMQNFYRSFLKWREDAGMNNRIVSNLPNMMKEVGLCSIEVFNSNEYYDRKSENFEYSVGIWSQVAEGLNQIVEEGYITKKSRETAINEYNEWVEDEAISMTMKLNEVRGKLKATNAI